LVHYLRLIIFFRRTIPNVKKIRNLAAEILEVPNHILEVIVQNFLAEIVLIRLLDLVLKILNEVKLVLFNLLVSLEFAFDLPSGLIPTAKIFELGLQLPQ
jgi:hypothetical protein